MNGTLIGASLGPGDPGLITRAAWSALKHATCWAHPVSRPGQPGYALAIAQRAGLTPPAHNLELHFPMTRDPALLAGSWQNAAHAVLERLQAGEDVHFLVEGDASTFATFGHLARTVTTLDPSIPIKVIPGVSTPQAVAARAGLTLSEGEEAMAMIPATRGAEAVGRLLDLCPTVALFKVRPVLEEMLDLLETKGLLAHACFVERVGAPEERVVRDVATLRGQTVHYLSLLLVRRPPTDPEALP